MTQNEAYGELAHAVVLTAVMDWKKLCEQILNPTQFADVVKANVRFDDLRRFFKSEWCYSLCVGVDPLTILAGLERELVDTEKQIKLLEVVNV